MTAHMKKIGYCAKVLPGYALKARAVHEPEGTHQVVMAKHLTECMPYRYSNDKELRITLKGSPDKYRIHKGDVLFVSRGIRNCAAVIESVPDRTVASSTFYILRCKSGVDPGYLAWCINQPLIQALISQIRTGAGTPIVQRSLFADIQIPLPPLAKQKRLAELGGLMAKERELQKKLFSTTEVYHRVIGNKLLAKISH